MTTLTLTPAQVSALECAGLDLDDLEPSEVMVRDAWTGRRLTVTHATRDALADALHDLANAEDAQAEEQGDQAARGASLALTNLAGKVRRARGADADA